MFSCDGQIPLNYHKKLLVLISDEQLLTDRSWLWYNILDIGLQNLSHNESDDKRRCHPHTAQFGGDSGRKKTMLVIGCFSCFQLGCVVFTRIEWFVFYLISCLQSIWRLVPISFSRQAGILAPIGLYSALYHPCEEFMNALRMLETLNVFNLYLGFCCHKCFLGLENNLSTGANLYPCM